MPSSIPYDPSLVLANIVSNAAIDIVKKISEAQAPADAAQEDLNSLMASRRSLDMTVTELTNLGIPTTDVAKSVEDLNKQIATAAAGYAVAKMAAEKTIQPLRSKIQMVHSEMESPVDYVQTQIKTLPLASDSLSMDVQYFSMDSNKQTADSFARSISSFVATSTSWLGTDASVQMTAAAQKQVSQQASQHSILGTLVLSISCTHKNASVLAPFVLNVDKGIKVWNHLFPSDKIVPTSTTAMTQLADSIPEEAANKFSIISGMTFGSSFVGMVHILNTTDTTVSESLSSYASSLQAQMDAGSWLEKFSGGFGVEDSIGKDVKNLLSTQNVTSHVTLICSGVIPSVVASDVKMGVQAFASFDPSANMTAIATINNATTGSQNSVQSSADAARLGGQMQSMRANDIKSTLSALQDVQDGSNKVLDINSMMTALDDYLKKAQTGDCGVPINFYLKDITKDMLAEMWVAKYYPGKFLAIKYDDSQSSAPAAAAAPAAAPDAAAPAVAATA